VRILPGRALAVASSLLCAALAACGGGGGTSSVPSAPVGTVPTPRASATPLPTPTATATPGASLLAVANLGFGGVGPSIETFAADADGNVAPRTLITGNNAHLEAQTPIALDRTGRLVSVNFDGTVSTLSVFAPGAAGNTLPERTIIDPDSSHALVGPGIDDQGNVYGFFIDAGGAGVEVYGPTANGFVAPIRVVHQASADLMIGYVDSYVGPHGDMWIAGDDSQHNEVLFEFPPLANGPTAPTLTMPLPLARFAVADDGTLMVQVPGGIAVYPAGASQSSGTYALDCGGSCFLAGASGTSAILIGLNGLGGELLTYQLTGSTNTTLRPIHVIAGSQTGLANPQFGAVR